MQTPLQRLIADYLRDHPDESYSSIARRGSTPDKELPRGTVQAIAKRDQYSRQLPREDTLAALARGMQMSLDRVREAAGYATGPTAGDAPEMQLLLAAVRDLDPERLEMVLRRARMLHEEMEEERRARHPRNGNGGRKNGDR